MAPSPWFSSASYSCAARLQKLVPIQPEPYFHGALAHLDPDHDISQIQKWSHREVAESHRPCRQEVGPRG